MTADAVSWTIAFPMALPDGSQLFIGDGGLETVEIKVPAVITTDLRLNTPRYATLPNIMKAKKKPLDVLKPDALGVDVAPRLKTLKVVEPGKRKAGVMVKDVGELVDKLRNEAKVL